MYSLRRNHSTGGPKMMIAALTTAILSCATFGLAAAQPPAALGPDATPDTAAGLIVDYPVFRRLEPPADYRQALERATRSPDGRPGPDYWQQRVAYQIEANLDPKNARLTGKERLRYFNQSPDTLPVLFVHLYQNVFSPGVERNRPVELTGGIAIHRVEVHDQRLEEVSASEARAMQRRGERPEGYLINGTLMAVALPEPIAPGDSVELGFEWSFHVPGQNAFRMGHIDQEVFNIAQWYPQVAAYSDVGGWDTKRYLGDGEFFLDYGDFDVQITVPEGWPVTATGVLQNADEVLTPEAQRRLKEAVNVDTVVRVVTPEERDRGRATASREDGELTWHYRAERVRDFAFATSSRYVWDAVGAEVGGELGRTRIDALYDPRLEHWRETAAEYSKHSVEFFSRYLFPYPYPHASAAYGPVGGMEYPMLVFIGRSRPGEPLYSVLAHEFSHEWFPMIVGSNEHRYAWMDEGLTTFNESLAREDFFGNEQARFQDLNRYLQVVRLGVEAPLMEHTDYVENGFGRGVAAYQKPAMLLHTLRKVLGAEVFDRAYRRYAEAWSYRHPMPWDFFAMVEQEAGRDLDWFWVPWFHETSTFDQAIESVQAEPGSVRLTVANRGEAVLPVDIELELENGSTIEDRWPVTVWAGTRRVTRTIPVDGTVAVVRLDPALYYPDIDRENNIWEAESPTTGEAGKSRSP